MKKQGIWAIVSVLVALGLILASCAKAPAPVAPTTPAAPTAPAAPAVEKPAPPKLIKLRIQGFPPYPKIERFPGMPPDMVLPLKQMIEAQFPGRLEIEIAPPGSLYPDAEVLQAVQKGLVDIAQGWGGFYTAMLPEGNVSMGLPFAWEDEGNVVDAFANFGLDDYMHEIYKEWNVYSTPHYGMGAIQGSGGYTFMANSPADLKGKKIRAVGVWQKWLAKLGGSAVLVSYPDMYMALKLGTIQGLILSVPALENVKAKEVLKSWVIYPNQSDYGASILYNLDSLNRLPDDIRTFLQNMSSPIMKGWMLVFMHNYQRWVAVQAEKDGYIKLIRWSEEDAQYTRELGYEIWDEIAALSPRTARGVEIIRKQQRDYGRMK